jgi:hypothetical protein
MLQRLMHREASRALRLQSRAVSTAASASVATPEGLERFREVPGFRAYPHAFPVSMTLKEYQSKYEAALEPKARCVDEPVAVAGACAAVGIGAAA